MSSERVVSGTNSACPSDLIQTLDRLSGATDIDVLLQSLAEASLKISSALVVEIALSSPHRATLQSACLLRTDGDGQRLFPDIGRAQLVQVAFREVKPQIGFLSDLDGEGGYHVLATPIQRVTVAGGAGPSAVGVIALGYTAPPSATPDLLQSLALLNNHFAFRLEQMLSERAALQRQARLDLVGEISTMVVQYGPSEVLFNTAIRRIEEVYQFEVAALYAGSPLTLRLLSRGQGNHLGTPVPETVVSRMPQDDTPMVIPELLADEAVALPPWASPQARTAVVIPLTYRNRRIGLLDFYGAFCELQGAENLKIFEILARQLAMLIVQADQEAPRKAAAQQRIAAPEVRNRGAAASVSDEAVHDTQQLQAAYDRLQEFAELKDQILQNVSHELRTPLTLVKGYLELMMDGEMGELQPEQIKNLQMVVGKVDDVTRIVEGIVSLSPLKRLAVSQQRISVTELITELALVFVQRTEGTDITWDFQPPEEDLYLSGDAAEIRQVFYNILDNSVKFSPEGGRIEVQALSEQGYVHIIFRDTGVGIPKPRLTRIFETFYQVDGSSTRRFGGLGLGLAVVARVVRAHNGKVWAESELGKGSTFHVLLPKYLSAHQVFQPTMSGRG